jgi:pimeloyl-ACP methyl ester carboxylesterase
MAPAVGGVLGGWIAGNGRPVLLLHGGPGLNYDYVDELGCELVAGFRVACYQQRGLAPSTLEGPFTIAQAIEDAIAVIDTLGWSKALIVGHSWGGHLAFRLMAAHPDRLLGVLAVDPLGIAGDGGRSAFGAELLARLSKGDRDQVQQIDDRAKGRDPTAEEALEQLAIIWPAYFADPENAPPMPTATRWSVEANSRILAEISSGTEEVAAALASSRVACGILAGAGSPMPWGQAARATADLCAGAALTVVPAAGHFVWLEVPGSVRAALERLSESI